LSPHSTLAPGDAPRRSLKLIQIYLKGYTPFTIYHLHHHERLSDADLRDRAAEP